MAVLDLVGGHTIYSCVVGSRAYGLANPDSDIDRRGVFVAPTPLFWSLDKPPTHLDGPAQEQFSWEVERCCELALQANPTVLECLWSPLVDHIDDTGRELIALRPAFLSRRLYDTYGSYARDQFKRLETARRRTGQVKWKQAMHMIRLLMAGIFVLGTREILVDVANHRAELLAVRNGERSWEEVKAWADRLSADLDKAAGTTTLPPGPDRAAVNDFLRKVRHANI
jgi:predicted nucleotidyltransferase